MSPPAPQSILVDTTQTFSITPSAGYVIDTVSGCNGSLSGNTFTTAEASANCTVSATFKLAPPPNYIITPSAGPNGAISPPAAQTVLAGATQAFILTPNAGYAVDVVSGCSGSLSGNTFTTAAATANCTVSATFKIAAGQSLAAIPTLSEWGVLLLGLLLAGAGTLGLRRRDGSV